MLFPEDHVEDDVPPQELASEQLTSEWIPEPVERALTSSESPQQVLESFPVPGITKKHEDISTDFLNRALVMIADIGREILAYEIVSNEWSKYESLKIKTALGTLSLRIDK